MQRNAVDNGAKVPESLAALPASTVSLPQVAARVIRRFQDGQLSGSVLLHFKDGRLVEAVETTPHRM